MNVPNQTPLNYEELQLYFKTAVEFNCAIEPTLWQTISEKIIS